MPEGPELHLASRFINNICRGRVFNRILKSDISKNPIVTPSCAQFVISATSRGKEIKLTLTDADRVADYQVDAKRKDTKSGSSSVLDIVFTFGLAGKFEFCKQDDLHKHAHLKFFTKDDKPDMVLSFVDYMRFGKWTPQADFSYKDRGPCVLTDYDNFRKHVIKNIKASVFDKPICEVLLNQKYFNGIGNYLRAEILHRLNIPPFVSARSVLQTLAEDTKIKSENPDVLQLCNIVPNEVVALESSWYDGGDRSDDTNAFNYWLQCYYQEGMKNMVDHNKRTIWYSGPAGPLAPKEGKTRGKKRSKSKKNQSDKESDESLQSDAKKASKRASNDAESTLNASKAKKSRHNASQKEANCSIEDLNSGRLTRGKIKQIVDAIENKPYEQKLASIKVENKAKKTKSDKRRTNKSKVMKNEEKDGGNNESGLISNEKCSKRKLVESLENGPVYQNKGRRLKTRNKSLKKTLS